MSKEYRDRTRSNMESGMCKYCGKIIPHEESTHYHMEIKRVDGYACLPCYKKKRPKMYEKLMPKEPELESKVEPYEPPKELKLEVAPKKEVAREDLPELVSKKKASKKAKSQSKSRSKKKASKKKR